MRRAQRRILLIAVLAVSIFAIIRLCSKNSSHNIGDVVDELNGVKVYYNGSTGNILDRNTVDGYNIGLRYQCVEFVKRYYFEYYHHKMPNSYGNAKDFYNRSLVDNSYNTDRALTQFSNPSSSKPQVGDLIVMDATTFNGYGHVAIVSDVGDEYVEIIQQNPGAYADSRDLFALDFENNQWYIGKKRILGWLRKEPSRK